MKKVKRPEIMQRNRFSGRDASRRALPGKSCTLVHLNGSFRAQRRSEYRTLARTQLRSSLPGDRDENFGGESGVLESPGEGLARVTG